MPGLGTIINCAGVIGGGLLGLLFGKLLKEKVRDILITASAVAVVFIGISGCLKEMLVVENNSVSTQGAMMLIVSLVLGGFIGEIIDIDKGIEKFGEFLKRKTGSQNDGNFVGGFVSTSVTISIGAMAVIGPFQDALEGNIDTLVAKTILDTIMVMSMTSALGKGCIFSVIPVAVIQGGFTAFAKLLEPIMTDTALSNINLVGSVLIFCIGLNLLRDKRIKVANMLPALIIAVIWAYLPF